MGAGDYFKAYFEKRCVRAGSVSPASLSLLMADAACARRSCGDGCVLKKPLSPFFPFALSAARNSGNPVGL